MSSSNIEQKDGKVLITGVLDENSDLKSLLELKGKVTFNFSGVVRINSCGVREWINVLQKMPSQQLVYEACPMVIVKQINAVPDFSKNASIDSFFAPYFCESCDEDQNVLIATKNIESGNPPAMKCATCQKEMVFDAIPNQYFGFIKRTKT